MDNELVKLKTADNVNNQISPDDAAQWEKGLHRILANQFTGTLDSGMLALLALLDATNPLKLAGGPRKREEAIRHVRYDCTCQVQE